jgi:hypothetical protein
MGVFRNMMDKMLDKLDQWLGGGQQGGYTLPEEEQLGGYAPRAQAPRSAQAPTRSVPAHGAGQPSWADRPVGDFGAAASPATNNGPTRFNGDITGSAVSVAGAAEFNGDITNSAVSAGRGSNVTISGGRVTGSAIGVGATVQNLSAEHSAALGDSIAGLGNALRGGSEPSAAAAQAGLGKQSPEGHATAPTNVTNSISITGGSFHNTQIGNGATMVNYMGAAPSSVAPPPSTPSPGGGAGKAPSGHSR